MGHGGFKTCGLIYARWDETAATAIRDHLAGKQPADDYSDYIAWNTRWASDDAILTLDEARERAERAHREVRNLLGELAPKAWDEIVHSWVRGSCWEHYQEHLDAPLEFPVNDPQKPAKLR